MVKVQFENADLVEAQVKLMPSDKAWPKPLHFRNIRRTLMNVYISIYTSIVDSHSGCAKVLYQEGMY